MLLATLAGVTSCVFFSCVTSGIKKVQPSVAYEPAEFKKIDQLPKAHPPNPYTGNNPPQVLHSSEDAGARIALARYNCDKATPTEVKKSELLKDMNDVVRAVPLPAPVQNSQNQRNAAPAEPQAVRKGRKITEYRCPQDIPQYLADYDPDSLKVYNRRQKVEMFNHYLDCSRPSALFGAETAIHESVHGIGPQLNHSEASKYGYFLPYTDQPETVIAHPRGLFPISRISVAMHQEIQRNDNFSYVDGQEGGQDVFTTLDELNAYTWGLKHATAVIHLRDPNIFGGIPGRGGVAFQMLILEKYLQQASKQTLFDQGKTTAAEALKASPGFLDHVQREWNNAEKAMNDSCPNPALENGATEILNRVYSANNIALMKEFFSSAGKTFTYSGVPRCADSARSTENGSKRISL